ncbi:hypothetical protein KEH56_11720 [Burkholderia cenocepacia]|nr:hypothetical protein KEH56_11720 [Burkholderia cenocepacia]QUO30512.1 hypothetical protein KEH57_22310 [Burkholderia cenocepacia]
MPAEKARGLSLEGHIALSVLRSGGGNVVQIGHLAKVNYLSYFMRDVTSAGVDIEQFRVAEVLIENCIVQAVRNGRWALREEEYSIIEQALLLFDMQLAVAPAYRYADAWRKLMYVVVENRRTPIKGSRIRSTPDEIYAVDVMVRDATALRTVDV